MKLIALAAALAFSGTAIAQDAPQPRSSETPGQADRLGGYEPSAPLFSSGGSTPPAGATVVFVPSTETPTQAFPPPAALAKYPLCKPRQYNNCLQRRR